MAHKQVLFRSDAREKILRGAAQLSDAVRCRTIQLQSQLLHVASKLLELQNWGAS